MLAKKSDNPNYLCKVVKIGKLDKHPNADRLQIAVVDYQRVITGLDAKEGGIYCYFPLESAINKSFLSYTNSFEDKSWNRNKEEKSFFNKHGRVRATKLRGIVSEGYIVPISSVNEWLKDQNIKYQLSEKDVDKSFDAFGDVVFCEKYVNPVVAEKLARKQERNKQGKIKREKKIVDNQVRLHVDTKHLKREIGEIKPDDWIEVAEKLHGSNGQVCRLLVNKKLGWKEKIAKFFGIDVVSTQYDLVYTSRRCIKSGEYVDQKTNDYYDENVWQKIAEKYKDSVKPGISLVGEVVGYTSTGAYIQPGYDYGCAPKESDFWVFRITYTSPNGDVFEFSLNQVVEYCKKYGLRHVPVHFVGKAKDMYPEIDTETHWHENFLNQLVNDFLEKDCDICVGKVPAEGVVVSRRTFDAFEPWKLKSLRFLERESKELDNGGGNLEDSN